MPNVLDNTVPESYTTLSNSTGLDFLKPSGFSASGLMITTCVHFSKKVNSRYPVLSLCFLTLNMENGRGEKSSVFYKV